MLKEILEREIATGFASLPGTRLKGTLPIPGTLLNQALREALAKRETPIKGVLLALLEDNKAIAVIGIDKWPLPKQVEIPFSIAPTVKREGQLIVSVTLDPPGGLLGVIVPILAGLIPGVDARGNTLEIDLGARLKQKSGHDLAPLIQNLELRTRRGFLDVAFTLEVPTPEAAQ